MNPVVIVVGALVGMALGSGFGLAALWFGAVVGGLAGFGITAFRQLRSRSDALSREVQALRTQIADVQRRLAEVGAAGRGVGASAPLDAAAAAEELGVGEDDAPLAEAKGLVGEGKPLVGEANPLVSEAKAAAREAEPLVGEPKAVVREAKPLLPEVEPEARGTSETGASSPAGPAQSLVAFFRDFFTGGNTVVRVGILILFFGVAFLLRYVAEHSQVPIQLRLSAVAGGGIALLILGWRLRARRLGYALALQGGGIGILYLTTFASLRLYSILPPAAALLLLVFIAIFSATLAVLQNSQAFALLAVTGGFLAPILASTGQGSHVVLFSYYAILNASIVAMAWYKAWRPLNFAGFTFTFLISAAWGVLHYNSGLFNSTEPFLVLFFLFYVAIAILFSLRQPPQLRGYVDGTLIFGTPMAAFGYQTAMLHGRPLVLAMSAIGIVIFYSLVALALHRRQRQTQRLLVETFVALAVVFFTVATPLALSGSATGVTWALEGVGLLWVGARQNRALPRIFGAALQVFVFLIQVGDVDGLYRVAASPPWGLYLARVLTAAAALLSAIVLNKYKHRVPRCAVLFFIGLAEWLLSGLLLIDQYAPHDYRASLALMFVALTAVGSSELSRRVALNVARLPALGLLPAMIVFAVCLATPPVRRPFDDWGWLAWPLAFAGFYVICRRHEGVANYPVARWLHVGSLWLMVALLTWQSAWWVDQGVAGQGTWVAVAWMVVPAAALYLVLRLVDRIEWPLRAHREAYALVGGGGLALSLAFWSLATNLTLVGDPYPFPYLPLLNALDLAQLLALVMLVRFRLYLKSGRSGLDTVPLTVGVGVLLFVWLNAVLIRTLHRWGKVPFEPDAVLSSTLLQTSVSIFWTVLALATMLVASRRASRPLWITGASLLAATVVKLFVIDLSRVGTVERIVSFVGVGLLTLVIGYFSPLPPPATSRRAAT